MKVVLQDGRRYVLRFDKDEDVMAKLAEFMSEGKIFACAFSGVGSSSLVELGYFNPALKQYRKKPFMENFEVISFQGNGGIVDKKPVIHAHGMFGRTDFTTVGGHVFKLVVLATCEIFVIKLKGSLNRANNPDFDLNLLS